MNLELNRPYIVCLYNSESIYTMYLSEDASPSVEYEGNAYGWVSNIFKATVWCDSGAAYDSILDEYNFKRGCKLLSVPDPRYCIEDLLKI